MRIRCWLCVPMLIACATGFAQPIPEADVKAAFIFNFVAFTEWPADAMKDATSLTACVSAASPLRRTLSSLDGRLVKSRPFRVRVQATLDDIEHCHLVVVESADRARIPVLLHAAGARPLLTIGDGAEMERDGLAVALSVEQSRLRFRVNLQAVRAAQIEISSKVLRLAQGVD